MVHLAAWRAAISVNILRWRAAPRESARTAGRSTRLVRRTERAVVEFPEGGVRPGRDARLPRNAPAVRCVQSLRPRTPPNENSSAREGSCRRTKNEDEETGRTLADAGARRRRNG